MAFQIVNSFSKMSGLTRMGRFVSSQILSRKTFSSSGASVRNIFQKENLIAANNKGLFSTSSGVKPISVGRHYSKETFGFYTFPDGKTCDGKSPEDWPTVPIIPIRTTSLMPLDMLSEFKITNKALIEIIKRKVDEDEPYFGFFLVKDEKNTSNIVKSVDDLFPIGTLGKIVRIAGYKDGLAFLVAGNRRISINNVRKETQGIDGSVENKTANNVLIADIDNITDEEYENNDEIKELVSKVQKALLDICKLNDDHRRFIQVLLQKLWEHNKDPAILSDYCGTVAKESVTPKELQALLEERNIPKRLQLALELLKKDYDKRSKVLPENWGPSFLHTTKTDY